MDRLATEGPFSKTDSDDEEVSKPENHDSEHLPKGKETEPILELEQGQAVQTPPNTRFMREVIWDGNVPKLFDDVAEHGVPILLLPSRPLLTIEMYVMQF